MTSSDCLLARSARFARACQALACASAFGSILLLPQVKALLPTCMFHELTGASCPTCGLTRSLEAASHGHILAAVQFHLLGPFFFAGLVAGCIICAMESLTGKRIVKFPSRRAQQFALLGGAAIWVAYGVGRAIVELL
jgi:hypothetical protein